VWPPPSAPPHRRTSLFPDSKAGTYLLPVKRAVRDAEHLDAGDDIRAQLELADL
jgi:hypothetical protein